MNKRLAVLLLAAVGCSDSTGPSSVAHHMDALYKQACAQAYRPSSGYANGAGYDTASGYWYRCQLLSVLLAAPASGAEPTAITVKTGAGTSTWDAIVINEFDSGGGHYLTSITDFIAYSDANVTNAVVTEDVQYYPSGGGIGVYILANDTVVENATYPGMTGSVTTGALGSRCHDASGLSDPLANPLTGYPPIEYGPSICQLATFEAAMSATFAPLPGLDPNLESVSVASQAVSGISVVPNAGFYASRVAAPRVFH